MRYFYIARLYIKMYIGAFPVASEKQKFNSMADSKLLQEAIADAKAVRQTALLNAKAALEEAFTPKLQSMLSSKLKQEMEDDSEEENDSKDTEVKEQDDGGEKEEKASEDSEEKMEETKSKKTEQEDDEDDDETEAEADDADVSGDEELELDIDIEDDEEEAEEEEDEDELEEISLKKVVDELKADLSEQDDDEEEAEKSEEAEEEKEDDEEISEELVSAVLEELLGEQDDEEEKEDEKEVGEQADDEEEDEEEIDLEEVLKELQKEAEEDEEDEDEEEIEESKTKSSTKKSTVVNERIKTLEEEVSTLKKENAEYCSVLKQLRSRLGEINLLNAKLLYTNKLFKEFALNNDQKVKVVEQFDLAKTLREAKLVYATLAETFGFSKKTSKKEVASKITEGLASKVAGSTKPTKEEILSESSEMAKRFKQLAGIKSK